MPIGQPSSFYSSTQGEISPGLELLAVTCSYSSLHNKNDYIIMQEIQLGSLHCFPHERVGSGVY